MPTRLNGQELRTAYAALPSTPLEEESPEGQLAAHYERYGPMVFRRCLALLRDQERALEARNDVFLRLLSRPRLFPLISPGRLLLLMATQVCLNRLREERCRPEQAADPDYARLLGIAAVNEDPESRSLAGVILRRLFRREPVSTRVIATLHFVDKLTLEEVAREVGLSVSGVRRRLRLLQQRLDAREGE
jgi:RNA polymerase sigma factor (sigma-70 family)